MKPTSFRAYAVEPALSRGLVDGKKQNFEHEVENPAFEGEVVDGAAKFDAGKTVITKVAFYAGEGDDTAVCAAAEFNRAGKFNLRFVEATEDSEAAIVEA